MWREVVTQIIAQLGIPSLVMSLGIWAIKRMIDAQEKKREAKEAVRDQMLGLIIRGTDASISLGEAVAIAQKNGKCNGETSEALEYARRVKHEQRDFLAQQGVKNIF